MTVFLSSPQKLNSFLLPLKRRTIYPADVERTWELIMQKKEKAAKLHDISTNNNRLM